MYSAEAWLIPRDPLLQKQRLGHSDFIGRTTHTSTSTKKRTPSAQSCTHGFGDELLGVTEELGAFLRRGLTVNILAAYTTNTFLPKGRKAYPPTHLKRVQTDIHLSFVGVLHAERVRPRNREPSNLLFVVEAPPSLAQERYPCSAPSTHAGSADMREARTCKQNFPALSAGREKQNKTPECCEGKRKRLAQHQPLEWAVQKRRVCGVTSRS